MLAIWWEGSVLVNRATGAVLASRVVLCDTFWSKFRGLMFRRPLDPDEAFVFSARRESIHDVAIHMMFVFFPISVLWLDSRKRVVGSTLAKPFRPYYAPGQAAQYFVEGVPQMLERASLGDELCFAHGKNGPQGHE